jgi:hypothetical protein
MVLCELHQERLATFRGFADKELSRADFAMSKIAVNETYGGNLLRKAIDYFCHLAVAPEFLARLPKHRQSSLSFIIARDSLPPLAAAHMRPSRRSYVRRRMIQGALKTRCELSAASFPSITVPVARQRHSARMHGLILPGR